MKIDIPRILVVDDEKDHLHLLSTLLSKKGFEVYSLSNPAEIGAIVISFKPNIVVLDVRIGKYDGKEICKQLKSAEHSKGIKVILHSAYPEIKNEYKLCGADEFILKPVAIDHLVSRLNYNLKK
jgi:DNA-binding response OmpR family regulator